MMERNDNISVGVTLGPPITTQFDISTHHPSTVQVPSNLNLLGL